MENRPFKVFSGTNSKYLAEEICAQLGCPLGKCNVQHFADGEFGVSYEESIRGNYVFIVQSTFPNADNLMELLLMVASWKSASRHIFRNSIADSTIPSGVSPQMSNTRLANEP